MRYYGGKWRNRIFRSWCIKSREKINMKLGTRMLKSQITKNGLYLRNKSDVSHADKDRVKWLRATVPKNQTVPTVGSSKFSHFPLSLTYFYDENRHPNYFFSDFGYFGWNGPLKICPIFLFFFIFLEIWDFFASKAAKIFNFVAFFVNSVYPHNYWLP